MTATTAQVRYAADLYRAASTPVAASLVISICDQLDEAKESINALTLALEVERDAANLYAKQVAHWIEKHDALLAQQLDTAPATTTQPSQARELPKHPVALSRDDTEHGVYYYKASEVDAIIAAINAKEQQT